MGRCGDGSCPSTASGSPGQEGSCPLHLEPGSRGAMAFHPSPLLEGIAAKLVYLPFLKGSDAPSCFPPLHPLQFPGRQPLGKQWKRWSWQDCTAQHQVVGAPGVPSAPACIPLVGGQRDLLPQEQLLSVCPAQHRCVTASWAEGMVLQELLLSWVPPRGHRASLLCRIRAARRWVQERGGGGCSAAVLCP